jgi:hypothetical protein
MYRLFHQQPWTTAQVCFGDDDGEGNGGGGKPNASALLGQYNGDAVRMAEKLAEVLGDNATLRDQRRGLREEVTTLKAKQTPEGARVLTGEEATAYDAYAALGKPADLTKRLSDADAATQRLTGLERDATLRDVAQAAGYKFAVLKQLGGDREYELRDATDAQGKPVKVAHIKDGDTYKPLGDFAQSAWGDFLPALAAQQGQGGGTGQGQQQGQGLAFPRQQGGGGTGPRTLVDDFIAQRNEAASKAPNPLAPAAAAAR